MAKPFAQPSWLGDEPLSGKTVLLHHEQGLGDTLQFCRYASLVAQAGARVVLAVPRPLAALLRGQEVVSAVIEPGAVLPAFDLHCPMMSLPLAFKTTLATIPFADRYLTADEEKRAYWDQSLGARIRPRVGLVWNGGFRANQPEAWAVNERRNMPVRHLAALKGLDCQFISLQKGDPAEVEFKQLQQQGWDGPDIVNRVDELKDFSDTAALIASLDLVIAVDTSVAHLAGALGKPVWMLNRFDSCWRWLVDRQDSPWYQSMRIFNQTSPGDWDGVMRQVVAALQSGQHRLGTPDDAQAHFNQGAAQSKLGQLKEACTSFSRAIALKPDFAKAYALRGAALRDLKQLEAALSDYDRAVELEPGIFARHVNRANVLVSRALQIGPANVNVYLNLAAMQKESGQLQAAVASYDKVLSIDHGLVQVHYKRGMVLRQLQRHEDAIASYDKAIAIEPGVAAAHYDRGKSLEALRRHEEALASHNRVIEIDPSFAAAYCARGVVQHKLNQLAAAVDSYRKAIDLAPEKRTP